MMLRISALVLCLCALGACTSSRHGPPKPVTMDIHSFSRPNDVRVRHVSLDIELDFESHRLAGTVELTLDRLVEDAPLVLDVQGLLIRWVSGADGSARTYELGGDHPRFGQPLSIQLEPEDDTIRLTYATTDGADALQWLSPEQTAGGDHPFLYTQGQAVLTRTWIPLQDTPGVRVTYDARVVAPEGLTVVMSAEQLGRGEDGAWRFRMEQPIPAYLIALACGDLTFAAISERCGVYAEPSLIEPSRYEFQDTEAMIQSAEELFGPYRWGRYDVIILPPAFPYGGMENPRLTFATPTILAGDRSLVALIAHELAHSWSGNLVTNATWSDFWLNEGFTSYLEKRIMEAVFGDERAKMEKSLDYDGLVEEMSEMDPIDQILNVDLSGRHPDDGFSGVPYEKGALFLRRLEQIFGREVFDEFLNDYFDEYTFESITTEEFERFLRRELLDGQPDRSAEIDIEQWLHGVGLPADAPRTRSDVLALVDKDRTAWLAGAKLTSIRTGGWVTQQWLHFLEGMPDDLGADRMGRLDEAFDLGHSGNNEILCVWLRLAIQHGYSAADERLDEFLMTVGRRKFLQPLYKEMAKTKGGRARALAIYASARPRYHAVSTGTLDDLLGFEPGKPAR